MKTIIMFIKYKNVNINVNILLYLILLIYCVNSTLF